GPLLACRMMFDHIAQKLPPRTGIALLQGDHGGVAALQLPLPNVDGPVSVDAFSLRREPEVFRIKLGLQGYFHKRGLVDFQPLTLGCHMNEDCTPPPPVPSPSRTSEWSTPEIFCPCAFGAACRQSDA